MLSLTNLYNEYKAQQKLTEQKNTYLKVVRVINRKAVLKAIIGDNDEGHKPDKYIFTNFELLDSEIFLDKNYSGVKIALNKSQIINQRKHFLYVF